jgi:hypothetical protein
MSKRYFIKQLRLVLPEEAARLGIRAESPVFVSPIIDGTRLCGDCAITFTPLVYQTGYETEAHHFQPRSGGIYFYLPCQPRLRTALLEQTGWMAHIEPLGRPIFSDDCTGSIGRAPAIRCIGIEAWCVCHAPDFRRYTANRHVGHLLDAGLIIQQPVPISPLRFLLPVCDELDLPVCVAPFRFHIRDGTVYFTQRS